MLAFPLRIFAPDVHVQQQHVHDGGQRDEWEVLCSEIIHPFIVGDSGLACKGQKDTQYGVDYWGRNGCKIKSVGRQRERLSHGRNE